MEHSITFKDVTKIYEVDDKTINALQNINFTADSGDIVGIIGFDGAGKSTLANLLIGQTQPDAGEINMNGRISLASNTPALNDKLTGRENIDLKCMILGFNKKEINERMPDIIAFAELGDFIDKPVQIYSDEMKSRLDFAIAVFIDPDILVIDEAVSDVDQDFADKCMDKLKALKESGKTIFFISHSMEQIKSICQEVLWLDAGEIKAYGGMEEIIPQYQAFLEASKVSPEEEEEQIPAPESTEQENVQTMEVKQDAAFSRSELRATQKKIRFNPLIKRISIVLLIIAFIYTGVAIIGKSSVTTSTEPEKDPGPDIRYVIVDEADIRKKPEFGSEVASKASYGQGFNVIGEKDSSAKSITWLKVESNTTDQSGWVSDQLMKKMTVELDDQEISDKIDKLIGFTPSLEDVIPMIGKTKGKEEAYDYTKYKYEDDQVIGFTITVNDSSEEEVFDLLGEPQLKKGGTHLYHGSKYDFIFTLGNEVVDELSVMEN